MRSGFKTFFAVLVAGFLLAGCTRVDQTKFDLSMASGSAEFINCMNDDAPGLC